MRKILDKNIIVAKNTKNENHWIYPFFFVFGADTSDQQKKEIK